MTAVAALAGDEPVGLTGSLAAGAEFAGRVAALPGAEGHVLLDIRDDRVVTTVQTASAGWVLPEDLELARQITALSASLGLVPRFADDPRSPQIIEIIIARSCRGDRRPSRVAGEGKGGCWTSARRPDRSPREARSASYRGVQEVSPGRNQSRGS
jgi:hypothetical protein